MTQGMRKGGNGWPGEYPQHHELPRGPENFRPKYTRCFWLRATGTRKPGHSDGRLRDLGFWLTAATDHDNVDGVEEPIWINRVEEMLDPSKPMVPHRTEMDFGLRHPSRIIIRLDGWFWRFSMLTEPLTMKRDCGERFFDLQRHVLGKDGAPRKPRPGERYDCISFFCARPYGPELGIRDGFNLNLELLMTVNGNRIALPITVDPDVENQGEPPPDDGEGM